MLVLFADDYTLHAPRFEYYDGKKTVYAERPDRMAKILQACQKKAVPTHKIDSLASANTIARLHNEHYISYLREKCSDIKDTDQLMPSSFIADTYTPLTRHTYEAALKSAELALVASDRLLKGVDTVIYALCRPPGHHAESASMMGYCYFNNAALAADQLAKYGRVSILDIDYHHGNGTQNFFYERADVQYVSIHADPHYAYPYATGFNDETGKNEGLGYNFNFPLPAETTPQSYIVALNQAIQKILDYKPNFIVLSLGFDAYENDPIGGLGLDEKTYLEIGKLLATTLQLPTIIVQEGGYNIDKLEVLAENFLTGYLA